MNKYTLLLWNWIVKTMIPKSKIIYSTLLPRADIPLQTLLKVNTKLIDSLSTLPNVHLVSHENIFSKGTDILHDIKHLKKETPWFICRKSCSSSTWPSYNENSSFFPESSTSPSAPNLAPALHNAYGSPWFSHSYG